MIRLVAVDMDGTITESSRSLKLSPHSIEAVRILKSRGLRVVLVTGNSLPVAASMSLYLGARDPVVAENGCIIFYLDAMSEEHLCSGKPGEDVVDLVVSRGFKPAWQNKYREHDLAFHPPRDLNHESLEELKTLLEARKYRVYWSGFALHVQPEGGGKDRGVEAILRKLNISWGETAAIGDGENDIPLLLKAQISATPADGAEAVKRVVKYVATKPGGEGFLEFARLIASTLP
ncbi:MAG: phosphoglycolate phosphatase [Thermoprotei archaeon]|nr:phosphoglycolate phosphatase [Thermoprotei archaeon]